MASTSNSGRNPGLYIMLEQHGHQHFASQSAPRRQRGEAPADPTRWRHEAYAQCLTHPAAANF